MAYSLSPGDIAYAHSLASRGVAQMHHLSHRGETLTGKVVQSTLVSLTSFGFGFLAGNLGAVDVAGVPLELGVGLLCAVGAYGGVGGKHSDMLQAIGDGALAFYFGKKGAAMGDGYRRKAGRKIARPAFPSASGTQVIAGGDRRPLTENELAAFAAAARS